MENTSILGFDEFHKDLQKLQIKFEELITQCKELKNTTSDTNEALEGKNTENCLGELCSFRIEHQQFCDMIRTNANKDLDIPIWEKYTLTIEEAAKYFRIGENKIRKFAEENLASSWVLMNGNRIQIKRKQFEKIIDSLDTI